MQKVQLGISDLMVTDVCLGTMTFGEQVDEKTAFDILDRAVGQGINFLDTAEMYSVPTRKETYGATETILGNWFGRGSVSRSDIVLATKVAGPSRGTPWIREGAGLTGQDIIASCEGSLKRLKTDYIDLYQIHWPERHVPAFGRRYFDPDKKHEPFTTIEEQLQALNTLVKAGKVRYIGLSNETPYGVSEFIRLAEQMGLPRVATIQNPYCLLNRAYENGLDEMCYRHKVSLLAYSPLGYGLLTGKYDQTGTTGPDAPAEARITRYESVQKQRWGRAACLEAARAYNAFARELGLSPVQLALGFCNSKWQVDSTIIGVRTLEQLDENISAMQTRLDADVLAQLDEMRQKYYDPAQ